MTKNGIYNSIYEIVKLIPKGYVATYGQVASLAGIEGHARLVGYALNCLPDRADVPWHRVINAKGKISMRSTPGAADYQRHLLETEGVRFSQSGTISFERFLWKWKKGDSF